MPEAIGHRCPLATSLLHDLECALDGGQFSSGVFDRLLGVAILVLRGAQIA